jgi:ATP-dependent DNA ligase
MNLDSFYEQIYVIHWKPLKERRIYLEDIFEKNNLTKIIMWVDQYETENDLKDVKNPFNLNKKLLSHKSTVL